MLIVSPKEIVEQREVVGRDIVFVTDISGSMAGEPLEQAKLGLQAMFAQLGKRTASRWSASTTRATRCSASSWSSRPGTQEDALAGVAALETQGRHEHPRRTAARARAAG